MAVRYSTQTTPANVRRLFNAETRPDAQARARERELMQMVSYLQRKNAATLMRLRLLHNEGVLIVNDQANEAARNDAEHFLDWAAAEVKGGAQ